MAQSKRCLDLVRDLHGAEAFAPVWEGQPAAEWQRQQVTGNRVRRYAGIDVVG